MSQPPAGRSRLAVVLAAGVVGFVLAGSLAVLLDLDDDDAVGRAPVRAASALGDVCAVVQPLLPQGLGLVADRPASSADRAAGIRRSRCTFGSQGAAALEVVVTSYDLPGDDPGATLDQLVATACDGAGRTFPEEFAADEQGCSGQDVAGAAEPVVVTAARIARIDHHNAVVAVFLTDRRLPAQVAAYASAIAYDVVASDLGAAPDGRED